MAGSGWLYSSRLALYGRTRPFIIFRVLPYQGQLSSWSLSGLRLPTLVPQPVEHEGG